MIVFMIVMGTFLMGMGVGITCVSDVWTSEWLCGVVIAFAGVFIVWFPTILDWLRKR